MAKQVRVPAVDAEDDEYIKFAHSYNGYELHGGMDGLSALVEVVRDYWRQTGALPGNVDVLRACLFYEARAHRHGGGYGRFDQEPFVAALVRFFRQMSGERVPAKGTVT